MKYMREPFLRTLFINLESIEEIEPPTVTVCFDPPFKPSVFEKYGVNEALFKYISFPNVNTNKTVMVGLCKEHWSLERKAQGFFCRSIRSGASKKWY